MRPAATVLLVSRSMRMKPPSERFTAYGSNTRSRSSCISHTPMSLSSSRSAGSRSSVLTLILCFKGVIVAAQVRACDFMR